MKYLQLIALGLIASAPISARAGDPDTTFAPPETEAQQKQSNVRGSIRGRVIYEGSAPTARKLSIHANAEICGAKKPILGEELVVGRGSGLVNTAVFLAGITERTPRRKEAVLEQKNCVFSPHVQTVTEGSQLVIGNDDPVIHNVHARLGPTTVFNLGMPLRGVKVKRGVGEPGVVSLQCDSGHTWMLAYIVVVPHSYHATSNGAGEFQIGDVLPGAYTLRTWHELLGVVDTPVVVRPGEETRLEVKYAAKSREELQPRALARVDFAAPRAPVAPEPREDKNEQMEAQLRANAEASAKNEVAMRRAARIANIAAGQGLYSRYCAACHGDRGDGRGEAALSLDTLPRDFTRGEYKFRSTKSGALPGEDDIFRTITFGIPGTDMPSWRKILAAAERQILANYVTTFSDRFLYAGPAPSVEIPSETTNDEASVARGREIYVRLQCAQCHGADGDARGVSKQMLDDWGNAIDATDLTRGLYKAGPFPRDRYRTLVTGLSGTPMPSFADLIGPDETWDLVHFLESLAEPRGFEELIGIP